MNCKHCNKSIDGENRVKEVIGRAFCGLHCHDLYMNHDPDEEAVIPLDELEAKGITIDLFKGPRRFFKTSHCTFVSIDQVYSVLLEMEGDEEVYQIYGSDGYVISFFKEDKARFEAWLESWGVA